MNFSNDVEVFWRNYLKGFSIPTPLVVEGLRGVRLQDDDQYGKREIALDKDLFELGKRQSLFQAAWAILLARYNAAVDAGHDADFARANLVHHHGALRRIETAPFYAYPSTAVVFGTYCGLRIDSDARVLRTDGSAIAGLHAAGEVTGGFHGAAYMTGSALGKAVVFGRIAGETAAAR